VGAAYLYKGPDILHNGLLWTAIGLIAVLASIVGARLFGLWRSWRAKAAVRPAPAIHSVPSGDPHDVEMSALIAEANAVLAKAPSLAGRTLAAMPLYLLIGPEGSGKTSTFLNSGLEPQLLAGQGTAPVAPTRLCNLWLAKDAIFAEIGGRVFAGELNRWSQLLETLCGQAAVPLWRRLWGEAEPRMSLRGVIGFFDSKELTGASSDPQRLERCSRDWQERLRSIADRFGGGFPVYLLITECDKIPFFSDFFRRLPESEVNQALGCTLPAQNPPASRQNGVFVEAEAKRLTASFRPLYHALARRRLTQLAHEPNPATRPGIYEFPRELKRIRSPLVQFLTDVFRPSALGPSPVLRGYYLTGVRETEVDIRDPAGRAMGAALQAPMDTTLFRGDVTQIFQGDDFTKGPISGGRRGLVARWMFVVDLFHRVIIPDQPPRKARQPEGPFEQYRKLAFGAVCGLCALLCLAFFASWVNNCHVLSELSDTTSRQTNRQGRPTSLQDLKALDDLREEVVKLEGHFSWWYHWGLYSGDRVLDRVRAAYFRQFQNLLLNDLNGLMMADLEGLPANPDAGAPYEPTYGTLRAHLMITSGSCAVAAPFLSGKLKDIRARIQPDARPEWQTLADRQIDFYSRELAAGGSPLRLAEDSGARERARQYLRQVKGIDRLYAGILAKTEASLGKSSRLSDIAPNYAVVLNGPEEVSPAFSREGWAYLEKASRENNATELGEPCVLGGASGTAADRKESAETALAIQRLYLRDYVDRWRKFVEGFSVIRYNNARDAARKLEILADHKSPLLAVFAMTANQTNFPAPAAQTDTSAVEKGVQQVQKLLSPLTKGETSATAAVDTPANPDTLNRPTDITTYFQPVHAVEPPGSETWVVGKNGAYIDALTQLRASMEAIAEGGDSDPAVQATASQNYDKALATAYEIEKGLKPVGVGGLDVTVERLLEAPIRLSYGFITKDLSKAGAEKVNRELRNFCKSEENTLRKYPFQASSMDDAKAEEFAGIFEPVKGAIWRFQQQSLADLAVKDGPIWKPKDPAKKPQVTPAMLAFLNRAQAIADVFYAGGAAHAKFTYTLRLKSDDRLKGASVEVEIDGQTYRWPGYLHVFNWPAAPGSKSGAVARRISTDFGAMPFESRSGIWGVFRLFADADPRELNDTTVQWRYSSVGQKEPMQYPVQLEIVEFPGGQDVFNPKFWETLRCPPAAVQ
jgi:type VI secretion system protein ImpL